MCRRMKTAPQLVVGTAGHIDHGKSRLVRALTGIDPDRLPEEKARGMTIDLGFAHTRIDECDIWFVDVPGHERFIRNMVAGATGIDVALLVVAADDSVMPQTREHAELLSLLGVTRCVVVLTKMDLVDDEWAEQVEEEVRALLEPLGLGPLEILRTSAETERGIDALRAALSGLARGGPARDATENWFRLPIDRAFGVPGRGTVVTGSLAHGSLARDDELELWPTGRRVRVRDLQTHHDHRDAVGGRMRLAVNLAGLSLDEVGRGCELATPGFLEATRRMDVWVQWLRMPGKTRRQVVRLRLHIATSEVLATLRLLEPPAQDVCREQFAQLKLSKPVVATWGQCFIVRDESGCRTLGGGRVLRPTARTWTAKWPPRAEELTVLKDGAPLARTEEVVRAWQWDGASLERLVVRGGLRTVDAAADLLQRLTGKQTVQRLEAGAARVSVHSSHLCSAAEVVSKRLRGHLEQNPRLPGISRGEWVGWMPRACPERLRPAVADWIVTRQHVALSDGFVVPRGHASAMSAADQELYDAILRELREAAFQPPAPAALRCRTPRNEKRIMELIKLAVARGALLRVGEGMWFETGRWDELVGTVTTAIRERGELTVADIRTLLESSRKYVVPVVEKLDALGITRRQVDVRVLGPSSR